jgi:hypothetical protein
MAMASGCSPTLTGVPAVSVAVVIGVTEVISENRFGQEGSLVPRREHMGRHADEQGCPEMGVEPR